MNRRASSLWPVIVAGCAAAPGPVAAGQDPMDQYNVVWDTPSADSSGSMPIGNGDIGLNIWVEPDGDVAFYLSKTDTWSENGRLLKLGRIRVKLSPNPFGKGRSFRQTLRLRQGEIEIQGGDGPAAVTLRIWVDAHRPVVRLEGIGERDFSLDTHLELWRTKPRTLKDREIHSAYSMAGGSEPIVVRPDTVLTDQGDRIVWCHRNETSCWPLTMKHQGLWGHVPGARDPLRHRTFGAAIQGDELIRRDATTLGSRRPRKRFVVSVYPLVRQTDSALAWLAALDRQIAAVDANDLESARRAHRQWWDAFWQRSWIRLPGQTKTKAAAGYDPPRRSGANGKRAASQTVGETDLHRIAQRYTLQRFVSACAGRGAYPIKFNGSIFTVDAREKKETYDADYRRWGGCYWFQNTRLVYWPMLASGDFEMMRPLFRMFLDALPVAKTRTRRYFEHEGACFPETMTFWGSYANSNYGWDRKGKPVWHCDNTYIRHYWSGQLELTALLLDHYVFTQDRGFARTMMLPLAEAAVRFYDRHYPRDGRGKLRFEPAQALETWHQAVNPLPEIAGLRFCLPRLLSLPEDLTTPEQRQAWRRLLGEVPDLPTRDLDGKPVLAAAEKLIGGVSNSENPELYAIFPYRLFGVGKPDLELARRTFAARRVKGNCGWRQDDTQAAFLGLTDEAARRVTDRFARKHVASRFPVFWGPNFDWIPDQDHGSNAILALQTMLMQAEGRVIRLLPAWPKGWDVDFKLHAPLNTTVEGTYRSGKLKRLVVTPAARAADVTTTVPR